MGKTNDTPLTDHLNELRKRIIYCIIFFFCAMIGGFVFSGRVVNHIKNDPAARHIDWHVFGLSDALSVYVKVSLVLGLIISLPFFLYQTWAFVKPGLKKSEQKIALRFIPGATLLFVLGIGFGYYILFPMVTRFMLMMTETLQAQELFGITEYFSFMFSIVLPFGVLFELPILVMFLTRLRIVNPIRLAKMRKVAYFVLVIIAVTITPPEIISDFLVTIPLLLLYEFSVWLSKGIYKKQLEEDAKWLDGEPTDEKIS
ncbi:twin-arginine translocase subunit TatC [Ammoniphilus sp. YIM 78166]|uniref:twin-arginine translocase subunit TatC n=1 Tax=Ammoniphilus sp. YIM 78166 TaxID=1644106 RepID=UPI00106FC162|nr:twin-arginine translocase subunit TatC [Ammoniphilus sp. YIM 78166]